MFNDILFGIKSYRQTKDFVYFSCSSVCKFDIKQAGHFYNNKNSGCG